MTDAQKPVVVVGAGPSGLVAACELLRLGVPVRVLEAEPEVASGSRAILLWPPSLEVFEELGVLADAEERGLRARALSYRMGDGATLRVDLGAQNEPLILPQQQTGQLLVAALHRLGGAVEHGVRVTGVADHQDGVTVRVTGPDGAAEIEADWVVAADGIGSAVRQQLGVEFAGDSVPTRYLLAEGELSGEVDRTVVRYYLGATGVLLIAPLPGGLVRVSGPVPPDLPVTEAGVQALLDERGPGGLRFTSFTALTTFTSQERIAATLRSGRTFLVGDAAHVHSAVGGQGLNLGLQDGRNLAWKLAGVRRGWLAPAVLDSYGPERRAAAEQVVRATSRMAKQAVARGGAARVRNAVWWLLHVTGLLRSWYAPMLAGWLSRYPDVLFGEPTSTRRGGVPGRGLPRAGSRTPAWARAVEVTGFRLVTLGAADSGLARAGAALAARHGEVLRHEHRTGRGTGFLLLRPDGYVAASGTGPAELTRAATLLAGLLTRPAPAEANR